MAADTSRMLQDPDFLSMDEAGRQKTIDLVLAKDHDFVGLSPQDKTAVRTRLYTKAIDPKSALPETVAGVAVPKEVAALAVGWGHGMQATEQGIAQMFGSKSAAEDEKAFRLLEADKMVGNFAKVGNVAGTMTAPENIVIPGAIGKGLLGMAKAGAVVGGAGGLVYPTVEGDSRLENAAIGAAIGTVGNLAVGALTNAFRTLRGKELIPWDGREMSAAAKAKLLADNPGLTEQTLQEIVDQRIGLENAKALSERVTAGFPDATPAWLEKGAKGVPKPFRDAVSDPDVKQMVAAQLARRDAVKAAITDDHEMFQFLQRETETAVAVREAEAAQARAIAGSNPQVVRKRGQQTYIKTDIETPEMALVPKEVPRDHVESIPYERVPREQLGLVPQERTVPPKGELRSAVELETTPEGKLVPKESLPGRERTLAEVHADVGLKPGFLQSATEKIAAAAQYKPLWIPPGQRGAISQNLLNRMAAAGIGGATGAYLDPDNPLQGAIFGAAIGVGGYEGARLAGKGLRAIFTKDTRPRIDQFADIRDGNVRAWQRETMKRQDELERLLKDPTRERDIYLAASGEKNVPLTPDERKAVLAWQKNADEIGQLGLSADVLKGLRDDYVTRIVDFSPTQSRSELINLLNSMAGGRGTGGSTSARTRFAKERVFDTLRDLEAAGYKLKTHNLSEIMGHYNASVINAIENKRMIEGIKAAIAPNGDRLIIPLAGLRSMPKDYVSISHPQLFGMAVHKDIAPSMRFIFDHYDPSTISKGVQALSQAIKRADVSFSLFHANALGQAYMGALGITKAAKDIVLAPFGKGGIEKMVNLYRNGGAGDIVDRGLRSGLRVGAGGTEDIDRTILTAALRDTASVADRFIPFKPIGKVASGIETVNKAVDAITWGHAHLGMKLQVFDAVAEKLALNNAAAHAKNPLVPLRSQMENDKLASSFSNDIFGSLDWRRIAEGVQNQFGRDLALWALAPGSRRVAQILLFAPDWTLSTLRAMMKSFGKGSGLPGLLKPSELADLHRQYVARSAFYFTVIGDGLNYAFTGHHLWDNKDPTRIELGDGRTLQLSKHSTEPIHDITHPMQSALSKMGVLPKAAMEQVLNKQYLSAYESDRFHVPPITKADDSFAAAAGKRAAHVLGSPVPIPIKQLAEQGPKAALLGAIGMPIYGKTTAEKEQAKREAAIQRMKDDLDPVKRAEKEKKKREKERQLRMQ